MLHLTTDDSLSRRVFITWGRDGW